MVIPSSQNSATNKLQAAIAVVWPAHYPSPLQLRRQCQPLSYIKKNHSLSIINQTMKIKDIALLLSFQFGITSTILNAKYSNGLKSMMLPNIAKEINKMYKTVQNIEIS